MIKKRINPKTHHTLNKKLHEMRKKVIVDIEKQIGRELNPTLIRRIDIALGMGGLAMLEVNETIDHTILEIRYQTYQEMADAFRRIEEGIFGICENCSEQILLGRLQVESYACFCAPCLSKIEEVEKAETRFEMPHL